MTLPPFAIRREHGITFIDAAHDAAFRKALLAGVPPALRGKMTEALAATPQNGARAHAQRYFGEEAGEVFAAASALAQELHRYLARQFHLDGLLDWLTATGYGNDYRMIKVFKAWSEMEVSTPKLIVPSLQRG